jgi:predicted TIM-barrel fold metal-dependent hydrolase
MPTNTMEPASDDLSGLQMIDGDAHFTEPPDLWTSRVPASFRDRVPVQKTIDGRTAWFIHDELWASVGGNVVERGGSEKVRGIHTVQPWDAIDPSAYSVKERLALLDDMGIQAQIIYPNGIGFASNHVFAIADRVLRTHVLQAYNDFLCDLQGESRGRLLPQAILPVWDMELTVSEMTRLLDRGLTGFTLSDKPELLDLPELVEPYFDPMWDLFNQSGAVANFHVGSGQRPESLNSVRHGGIAYQDSPWIWRAHQPQRALTVIAVHGPFSNIRVVANLTLSNLFDRFPGLKIALPESTIGWVPFFLEAVEYQFDELITSNEERAFTKRRPREYFHDHIFVSFYYERVAPAKLLEDIGVNNVFVETDYPHPLCLYPNPREFLLESMANVDPTIVRRVLRDNLAELYGIPAMDLAV